VVCDIFLAITFKERWCLVNWRQNTNETHENNKNSYLIIMIFSMCMQKYCSDTVVFLQQRLSCKLHELSSPAPLDTHGQKLYICLSQHELSLLHHEQLMVHQTWTDHIDLEFLLFLFFTYSTSATHIVIPIISY
jgi:hypothetical protein